MRGKIQLTTQIIIGMVFGVILGAVFGTKIAGVKIISDIFFKAHSNGRHSPSFLYGNCSHW